MIKILKKGMMCSIQDQGRCGYRHLGVPVSGWMDEVSAKSANLILHNNENDALIEIGPIGPDLLFLDETVITITGALRKCTLNKEAIPMYTPLRVNTGDILHLKSSQNGVWSYLAVKGGIRSKVIMNSRSFYTKAGIGDALIKGSTLRYEPELQMTKKNTNSRLSYRHPERTIKVNKGPEWTHLNESEKEVLINNPFRIGVKSDRMAYYLEHDNTIAISPDKGIITSVVNPGTVQLPPSGIPIRPLVDMPEYYKW